MKFDIIDITEDEISKLTDIQTQLLRTAQKKKNDLRFKTEQDYALFKKLAYTNGMKESSLLEQKRAELETEFLRQVEIIVEQLEYGLVLNAPYPDRGEGDEETGYIVDYTLSYNERYRIVRDYYLSITDPAERMALYSADDTARKYLGSYYASLYNVLYSYSK